MGSKKPFGTKMPYFAVFTVPSLLYISGSVYAQQITIAPQELLLISILLLLEKMQIIKGNYFFTVLIFIKLVLFYITLAYRIT